MALLSENDTIGHKIVVMVLSWLN